MSAHAPTAPRRIKILDVIDTAAAAKEILLWRVEAFNRIPHFENWIVCGPGRHLETLRSHGIPCLGIQMPKGVSLGRVSPLVTLWALIRLARFIRRHRFSIVHTHSPMPGVIGRLAAWIARVPVIIHVEHGSIFYEHQSPLARWLYMQVEKFMARLTDRLLYENPYEQQYAIDHGLTGKAQVHFVGSGINLSQFARRKARVDRRSSRELEAPQVGRDGRPGPGQRAKVVIANVARMDPIKNQKMLLQAAAVLRRSHPQFELWMVGDGICYPELVRFTVEHSLEPYVRFFGYRDDVPDLLSQADIGVLTSIKEGIPRGVMEPMAMGLPVVATNVKGNRQVIIDGETGFLVPLGDHVALAERLALLIENADLRRRMGEEGSKRIHQYFDERQMIRRILEVYLDLYPAPTTALAGSPLPATQVS